MAESPQAPHSFRSFGRRYLVFALLITRFLSPGNLSASQDLGSIRGKVIAETGGQPLPSATVFLEGTRIGTSTNDDGEFELNGIEPGRYIIIVRLVSYDERRDSGIVVTAGRTLFLQIQLVETAIRLSEIQITADRARKQDDVRASVLSLAPARAKTLAGGVEDVMRGLQALPGVLAPNDFTAQMIVRGSGPDENLIIMDDIEVFNPYRLYGLISMFNPETASNINLITSGFPAKYGDRLSAVLDVTNREGDGNVPAKGSLNASIASANLVLEGRLPIGVPASFIVAARRTYYDLILGPIAKRTGLVSGDVAFPNFTDFQGKVVVQPGGGHKLIANVLLSKDGVNLLSGPDRKENPDSVHVLDNSRNDVIGMAWHYLPSPTFLSKLSASWYKNTGDSRFGGDFIDPALNRDQFESGGDTTGIRFFNVEASSKYMFEKVAVHEEAAWMLPEQTIEAGLGLDFITTTLLWDFHPDETLKAILLSRGIPLVYTYQQSSSYVRLSTYMQDKVKLGDAFWVQPGIRLDYYQIIDKAYPLPRLNVSYGINALTTLRGAWGIYRQSPGYEKLLDQNQFFDLSSGHVAGLEAEKATHYVLGVDRWLTNEWQIRFEGYYKSFDQVIVQEIRPGTVYVTSPVPGGDIRTRDGWTPPVATIGDSVTSLPLNGAGGHSYGIEILLEKAMAGPDTRLTGWIGYSYARSERVRNDITRPFRFQQLHTINVVLNYHISSWCDVGISWKYGSNFPYTQPVGLKPRIVSAEQNGEEVKVIQTDANGNVIFDIDQGGEANKLRAQLPEYHRLDMRVSVFADWWNLDWTFYLDVINVYNRSNVLSYQFYTGDDLTVQQRPVTMLPIFPTLGFSVRF